MYKDFLQDKNKVYLVSAINHMKQSFMTKQKKKKMIIGKMKDVNKSIQLPSLLDYSLRFTYM